MAMKSSNSHERLDVRQPAGKLAFIFQIIFQVTCLKIKFGQIYCAFISYPNEEVWRQLAYFHSEPLEGTFHCPGLEQRVSACAGAVTSGFKYSCTLVYCGMKVQFSIP